MADIGTQLRTARTDAGIDIATAEHVTKIRSKYLRALEGGDWAALPEETAAISFLRTYGDYLGLDGRALVETFRAGQVSVGVPANYSPAALSADARRRRGWRTWLVVTLILVLIGGLFLIGTSSDAAAIEAFAHAIVLGSTR